MKEEISRGKGGNVQERKERAGESKTGQPATMQSGQLLISRLKCWQWKKILLISVGIAVPVLHWRNAGAEGCLLPTTITLRTRGQQENNRCGVCSLNLRHCLAATYEKVLSVPFVLVSAGRTF